MTILKPKVTYHLSNSKTGAMMGKCSARLVETANGSAINMTDAEGFTAVRGLVAFATKLKLDLSPYTTAFIDEEAFVKRSPAQVLALVETSEKAGLNCWISRKGNVTIGTRTEGKAPSKAHKREAVVGEKAALAAFMKAMS